MSDIFKILPLSVGGPPFQEQSLIGAVNVSGGVVDAGKIVLLNSSGQIDSSMVTGGSGSAQTFTPVLSGSPPEYEYLTGYNAITGLFSALPIPAGGGTQVNSDWLSVSGVTKILNKPQLAQTFVPTLAGSPPYDEYLTGYSATTGLFSSAPIPAIAGGGGGSGTVTSVGLAGTAGQVTVTGATPITGAGSWAVSLPNAVTLGIGGSAAGSLILAQTTAYATTIVGAATANWTLKLPTTAGTNLYVLQTDGAGNTSWVAQSGVGSMSITGGGIAVASPSPITGTGTVTVTGSSTNGKTVAVTDAGSVTSAPSGDVVTTDGHGNVIDSGILLSSISSGGSSSRTTAALTYNLAANTADATQAFLMAKSFNLIKVNVTGAGSNKCRVRLYSTAAARTADLNRYYTIPLQLGTQHGCIADFVFDQANAVTPWMCTPNIFGSNQDVGGSPAGPDSSIYANVQNFDVVTQSAMTVTLTFISMES